MWCGLGQKTSFVPCHWAPTFYLGYKTDFRSEHTSPVPGLLLPAAAAPSVPSAPHCWCQAAPWCWPCGDEAHEEPQGMQSCWDSAGAAASPLPCLHPWAEEAATGGETPLLHPLAPCAAIAPPSPAAVPPDPHMKHLLRAT